MNLKKADNPVKNSKNITNTLGSAVCERFTIDFGFNSFVKYDFLEPITTRSMKNQSKHELLWTLN